MNPLLIVGALVALVAVAVLRPAAQTQTAQTPAAGQAAPPPVQSYQVQPEPQQAASGYATPPPTQRPPAQPTASPSYGYSLPSVPPIQGVSYDPYALAAVQNAGGIISGLGSLAGALPGAIQGFQNLFDSGPPSLSELNSEWEDDGSNLVPSYDLSGLDSFVGGW